MTEKQGLRAVLIHRGLKHSSKRRLHKARLRAVLIHRGLKPLQGDHNTGPV